MGPGRRDGHSAGYEPARYGDVCTTFHLRAALFAVALRQSGDGGVGGGFVRPRRRAAGNPRRRRHRQLRLHPPRQPDRPHRQAGVLVGRTRTSASSAEPWLAHPRLSPEHRLVRLRARRDEQTPGRVPGSGEKIRPAQRRLLLRPGESRRRADATTPRRNPRLARPAPGGQAHLLRPAQVLRRVAPRDRRQAARFSSDASRRIEFRPARLLFLRRQIQVRVSANRKPTAARGEGRCISTWLGRLARAL